jgi:hypothetical protein
VPPYTVESFVWELDSWEFLNGGAGNEGTAGQVRSTSHHPVCVRDTERRTAAFLSGTVRDNAGVIPGATVVLSSGGSQVSTVTTDEGGSYRFPALMGAVSS